MAGVKRTLCWLSFYGVPLHAKDAVVDEILKSIPAKKVTEVLTQIPLVRVIAWVCDPLDVPNGYNLLFKGGEMYPITIDYSNRDPNEEKLKKLMQESLKIGERLRFKKN